MNRSTLIKRLKRLLPLKPTQWPRESGILTTSNQIQDSIIASTTVILDRLDSLEELIEAKTTKWEYYYEDYDSELCNLSNELNRYGEDGWELAGVAVLSDCIRYHFKRPIE